MTKRAKITLAKKLPKPKTNYFQDSGSLRIQVKRLNELNAALSKENAELKQSIQVLIQRG